MRRFGTFAALLLVVLAATAMFYAVLHQISSIWLDVALRPEVRAALEQSLNDQKKLRTLDPEQRELYRRRFEETQRLMNRIEVIRMNRRAVLQRFELAIVILFAIVALVAVATAWTRYRRAEERERREVAERLASWQEAARRQAHEIRGPLTAARLEVDRFAELARGGGTAEELERVQGSVIEELERLAAYTREFSSFGALGEPLLRRESLGRIAGEFCAIFANAWPNLRLIDAGGDAEVCADRDMIRHVLVNLCSNSSAATNGSGTVTLATTRSGDRVALEVRDRGGGIPPSLCARIFDPYVTTRKIGEGMGLGLAISRKIMLDHGGDLELTDTSPSGTTFRLLFGAPLC